MSERPAKAAPNVKMIPGKFYIIDRFTGPIAGPFDSAEAAEAERVEINISDDCDIGETYIVAPGRLRLRHVDIGPAH